MISLLYNTQNCMRLICKNGSTEALILRLFDQKTVRHQHDVSNFCSLTRRQVGASPNFRAFHNSRLEIQTLKKDFRRQQSNFGGITRSTGRGFAKLVQVLNVSQSAASFRAVCINAGRTTSRRVNITCKTVCLSS